MGNTPLNRDIFMKKIVESPVRRRKSLFMEQFFDPQSLAVIGVSPKKSNLARNVIKNCIDFGFRGKIFGVGTRSGRAFGIPILESIEAMPRGVELAVVLTPAQSVPDVIRRLGQKGIRRIILETGGFSEFDIGRKGLEDEILRIMHHYDQHLIGPNCLGIVNMKSGLCTPFVDYRYSVPTGSVSIISQSGGMGRTFFNVMENEAIGLNKFVSVGNKLDIGEAEILQYLLDDPETKLILLYLEDIRQGRNLLRIAANYDKPKIILKSNRGEMGSSTALSHTKAIATDDKVIDAALNKAGMIRINHTYEIGKVLKAFQIPVLKGPNLVVISRSGGHAVVAADACENQHFHLPPIPPTLVDKLKKHLRSNVIKLKNPLDMGDVYDMSVFLIAIEESLKQETIHGVIFILIYSEHTSGKDVRRIIPPLQELIKKYQKPIAAILISSADGLKKIKQQFPFPVFSFPEEAVEALAISYQHHLLSKHRQQSCTPFRIRFNPEVEDQIKRVKEAGRNFILHESLKMIETYSLPVPVYRLVHKNSEAVHFVRKFGFPVTLKIVSRGLLHKSDGGGVRLHLDTMAKLRQTFRELKIKMESLKDTEGGLMVQKMVPPGQELILGARRDSNFGPVVLFGLGGIFSELFKDFVIDLAPLNPAQVKKMVRQAKFFPILNGSKGQPCLDIDFIEKCLLKLSGLITSHKEIEEVDINPLIVYPKKGYIVDARIILAKTVN